MRHVRLFVFMVGMLCAISSVAQGTFTAQWHVVNLVGNIPVTNAYRVTLTPLAPLYATNAVLPDVPTVGSTDTNGAVAFTNTTAGYTYVFELDLPWKTIKTTNGFPAGLTGTVEAEPYSGIWIPSRQLFAYFNTNVLTGTYSALTVTNLTAGAITAASLTGNGGGLININGANVTGSVLLAETAGTAASATFADTAAESSIADVANAVSGSTALPASQLTGIIPTSNLGAVPVTSVYGAGDIADVAAKMRSGDWAFSNVFSTTWITDPGWTLSGVATNGGGQVYSLGGNPASAAYPMALGPNDCGRYIASFTVPSGGLGSAYAMMGISSDSPGTAPGSGGGTLHAFGLINGATLPTSWNLSGGFQVSGSPLGNVVLGPGTYNICMAVDTNIISWAVITPGHTNETLFKIPRTASAVATINNFAFWCGDSRGASGVVWNQMGGRNNNATITPRNAVEGQSDFVVWSQDDYGQNIRVWQPAAYDSKTNVGNLIIYFHGDGEDENITFQNYGDTNRLNYFQALVNSNFTIIASVCHGQHGVWGSPNSIADGEHLLQWYRAHYAYSNLFVMGASAGGASALNFIASRQEKVCGAILEYPVVNLDVMYATSYSNSINTAYGGTTAAQYAGYNPITNALAGYYGIPIRIYASPLDGVVSKALDADQIILKLGGVVNGNVTNAAYSPEVSEIATTGNHGDDSNFTNAVGDVAFFQRALTYQLGNQDAGISADRIRSDFTKAPRSPGYILLTNISLSGPVVANGNAAKWNSNGYVYLRTSRIGATNWQDTLQASPP